MTTPHCLFSVMAFISSMFSRRATQCGFSPGVPKEMDNLGIRSFQSRPFGSPAAPVAGNFPHAVDNLGSRAVGYLPRAGRLKRLRVYDGPDPFAHASDRFSSDSHPLDASDPPELLRFDSFGKSLRQDANGSDLN
jgi:hypothetical protein